MGLAGETWRVMCQDELCGEITITDVDMPWLSGSFTAGPAFSKVEPLFARELELLEHLDDNPEAWEEAYEKVTQAVRLVAPNGPVAEFLLHLQGGRAWFRWSEERCTDE